MFDYKPLKITLAEKDLTISQLCKDIGLSSATIAKFNKNEQVSMGVIAKICERLNCEIEDIVKYERK